MRSVIIIICKCLQSKVEEREGKVRQGELRKHFRLRGPAGLCLGPACLCPLCNCIKKRRQLVGGSEQRYKDAQPPVRLPPGPVPGPALQHPLPPAGTL